jgi:hypothetical protein
MNDKHFFVLLELKLKSLRDLDDKRSLLFWHAIVPVLQILRERRSLLGIPLIQVIQRLPMLQIFLQQRQQHLDRDHLIECTIRAVLFKLCEMVEIPLRQRLVFELRGVAETLIDIVIKRRAKRFPVALGGSVFQVSELQQKDDADENCRCSSHSTSLTQSNEMNIRNPEQLRKTYRAKSANLELLTVSLDNCLLQYTASREIDYPTPFA